MPSEAIEKVTHSLQMDEDIKLQVKGWQVQNISVAGIFIVILLGLSGLFGQGMLSEKKVEADGNSLVYEKFGRHGGESKLAFVLAAGDSVDEITIPAVYLDHFKIETIVPEPVKNNTVNNDYIFTFKSIGSNTVTFFLSPTKIGNITTILKANQTKFQLSHFIYP